MKKSGIIFLTVVLLFLIVLPVQAQQEHPVNARIEVNWNPNSLSSTAGGWSGTINCFNVKGEILVYKGIWAGALYTYGGNGRGSIFGVDYNELVYTDLELYGRIPLNFTSVSESDLRGTPTPPLNPFYVKLAYKINSLSSEGLGTYNWESGTGAGVGLGMDADMDKYSLYGDVAFYPSMHARNIPNPQPGISYTYKIWTYRGGLRFRMRDNLEAHLGYRGETHTYANLNVNYNGPMIGVDFKF